MMPMPTGRKATTMRIVIFQKTTAGPDSHTKWSTGGTFLRARRRSPHAFPGLPWTGGSGAVSRGSPVTSASFTIEDIFPFCPREILQAGGTSDNRTKAYIYDALTEPASWFLFTASCDASLLKFVVSVAF